MRLLLLEDVSSALADIQNKINKGKKLKSSDFDEVTDASDVAALLDKKSSNINPTGENEALVKEIYLRRLFGDKFDDVFGIFSLLKTSLDTLGIDDNSNLFLYYVEELAKAGITPKQNFANLVYSFIKSGKLNKKDLSDWLLETSVYESDPKDTQYKMETILFLTKQNGAKEYKLRIKQDDGRYRFLKINDLKDGTAFKPASEIKDILITAQQAGDDEADEKEAAQQNKSQKEEQDKELNAQQEKLIKNVVAQVMTKNPKISSYDIQQAVRGLYQDGDTEESLIKKVNSYLKKKGTPTVNTQAVQKAKITDSTQKRLKAALVAAGYEEDIVNAFITNKGYFDGSEPFADAFKKLSSILDKAEIS